MTTDPQTTAWLDQEDAHLVPADPRHRFAVHVRRARGDEPGEPPFGYTVGLFGAGPPGARRRRPRASRRRTPSCTRAAELVPSGRDLVPGEHYTGPDWPAGPLWRSAEPGLRCSSALNRFYQRPLDEFSVPAYQPDLAQHRRRHLAVGPGLLLRHRTASRGRVRGGPDAATARRHPVAVPGFRRPYRK